MLNINPFNWIWGPPSAPHEPDTVSIERTAEDSEAFLSNAKSVLEPLGLWDEGVKELILSILGDNELFLAFNPLFGSLQDT
ncbi:MAG: hypothetical protein K940chlam3_01284, partial [Chlamydiae bacterium]|nr:hypothetical protein [Chlamydiota bacterium]